MKTENKDTMQMVMALYESINMRKHYEKIEKELKSSIKKIMEDELVLEAGNYIVIITHNVRTGFDTEALKDHFGPKLIPFQKSTPYDTVEVCKKN